MNNVASQIRIGGRASKLSQWQIHEVKKNLEEIYPHLEFEIKLIQTAGDQDQKTPLPQIGSKGVFTAELEKALTDHQIDLAIHSQKDLPIEDSPGLCIGALLKRGPVQDALISQAAYTLDSLPKNAIIGTSSTRRQAQILSARSDLKIVPLRGNIDTRIQKSFELDGIILAYAGLFRLNLHSCVSQILPFLPAPAQGSIAIQCRQEKKWIQFLKPIHHSETELCTLAERAFLEGLGGGCSLPIAALASIDNQEISLQVQVLKPNGSAVINLKQSGHQARDLGLSLAKSCLSQGAREYIG